jgi:uncharacterized spore protein YtfJ
MEAFMRHTKDLVYINTIAGAPVKVGSMTITPQSQMIILGASSGGFVWNRPLAVIVEQDGIIKHLPIIDTTRIFQLGLMGIAFVLSILGILKFIILKEKHDE